MMADNTMQDDDSIPLPPEKEVLEMIQKQISSKKDKKDAKIEDKVSKPTDDFKFEGFDKPIDTDKKKLDDIAKPSLPQDKKAGFLDKFFSKEKKIIQVKPSENLEKTIENNPPKVHIDDLKSMLPQEKKPVEIKPIEKPAEIKPVEKPSSVLPSPQEKKIEKPVSPAPKKEWLFKKLFHMEKKSNIANSSNKPASKEELLPEIPLPPSPDDIGMESTDKAIMETKSDVESNEKELLKKIAQSSLMQEEQQVKEPVHEIPLPPNKEELKQEVKDQESFKVSEVIEEAEAVKPVETPPEIEEKELVVKEEPKYPAIVIPNIKPLNIPEIKEKVAQKPLQEIKTEEPKKVDVTSDISPDSQYYKDFVREQQKVEAMQKDLEKQFNEMDKRHIEFQNAEEQFNDQRKKTETDLLKKERELVDQKNQLDRASIIHEKEKQEQEAYQSKLNLKEESLKKWDIDLKEKFKEISSKMKTYENSLKEIEALKTKITKEVTERKNNIDLAEKELLDRAAVVEKREAELHERADSIVLKENTVSLKEKDIILKDAGLVSKDRMLDRKEASLLEWEDRLKKKEKELRDNENDYQSQYKSFQDQMTAFAKTKVDTEHELTVRSAMLNKLSSDLNKKEEDIPVKAKEAFLSYEQRLKKTEKDLARKEKDLEVEDEAIDYVEKKYVKERENLEENEFQFYMKQKLASPVDEDAGIETEHIAKLATELEPQLPQKKIFLLIKNCNQLIKNMKINEAKKLYNAIRDEYYRAELSISEKKDYFDQIKELYDDIQLADLKKR